MNIRLGMVLAASVIGLLLVSWFLVPCDSFFGLQSCKPKVPLSAAGPDAAQPETTQATAEEKENTSGKDSTSLQSTGVKTEGSVRTVAAKEISVEGSPSILSQRTAQEVLEELGRKLGYGEDVAITIEQMEKDEYGNTYFYVSRTYRNIPIIMSQARLEVIDGKAQSYSGQIDPFNIDDLDVEPSYTGEHAYSLFLQTIGASEEQSMVNKTELAVLLQQQDAALVWAFQVNLSHPQYSGHHFVAVDAHSGAITSLRKVRNH